MITKEELNCLINCCEDAIKSGNNFPAISECQRQALAFEYHEVDKGHWLTMALAIAGLPECRQQAIKVGNRKALIDKVIQISLAGESPVAPKVSRDYIRQVVAGAGAMAE